MIGIQPRVSADVIGWGLRCGLGQDPLAVCRQIADGHTAIALQDELSPLRDGRAAVADDPGLRPWLKRRKDAKLLARPAALVLPACGEALADWPGDRTALGGWLGVGQEPPDDGESEAALVASARDGRLDPDLLADVGRDLYPPLLPLRTLPNMALAHVSINLGLGGTNGVWAGGPEAGFHAVRGALFALAEGRTSAALAGATDSKVGLGSARDERRLGRLEAPGEAAAVVLLVPAGGPGARCSIGLVDRLDEAHLARARALARSHRPALGRCGAADGAVALLLACARVHAGGQAELLAVGHPEVILVVRQS